jgi:hypothetical protein
MKRLRPAERRAELSPARKLRSNRLPCLRRRRVQSIETPLTDYPLIWELLCQIAPKGRVWFRCVSLKQNDVEPLRQEPDEIIGMRWNWLEGELGPIVGMDKHGGGPARPDPPGCLVGQVEKVVGPLQVTDCKAIVPK